MINSFVHTIMYGYYCLTGLGVTANFVKPLITTVQMTQFVVLAAQSTYAIADGYRYWPATIAWVSTALMVQMLVLFGNFAVQAYCPRKGRGGGGAKDD
jgi:elongation of very long chain fatty acids protein 4